MGSIFGGGQAIAAPLIPQPAPAPAPVAQPPAPGTLTSTILKRGTNDPVLPPAAAAPAGETDEERWNRWAARSNNLILGGGYGAIGGGDGSSSGGTGADGGSGSASP